MASALRHLREGSRRRQPDQPCPQRHRSALDAQPRLDAGRGRGRPSQAAARMHPLSQGGQGDQGRLGARKRGARRPPSPSPSYVGMSPGGRPPPPTAQHVANLLLLLLGSLLLRHRSVTSFRQQSSQRSLRLPAGPALLPLPLLHRLLLLSALLRSSPLLHVGLTPFPVASVPHRLAPQVGGLLPAAALVVIEVDVELGQADDGQPPLGHRGVEHALVVRRRAG